MNENSSSSLRSTETFGWRFCYECTGPRESRLHTTNESEAFFWHLLGYEVVRLLERVER
ncbi:hypothetical protein QTI66_11995 [Variovorax sp. J22R133]|uniref:hypothetical protein n=1 Tax=Variovorax brevis TaxID=3053503 RepID=UPI0025758970|nr:hypothetical protein [Variovorax sp. J22R133]MDM0112873.1 hypothetical protein [Variovorax sp. J22R133]